MTEKGDLVKEELLRIAKRRNGLLKTHDVLQEAAKEESPLHPHFQWDDSVAAQEYRLWQARQLITIHVECIAGSDDEYQVFVSLTPDRKLKGGGYRTMVSVLNDKQLRSQLLEDARADMLRFRQKYSQLKELEEVFDAMKRAAGKKRAAA